MKKLYQIKNINIGGTNFANYAQYGFLAIKSHTYAILTPNQLESIRRCLLRAIKRKGIIWIRVQCTYPLTKKSDGSRMGKGVGPIKSYIAHIKKGCVLIELQTELSKELITCIKKVLLRLSVKSSIMFRSYY